MDQNPQSNNSQSFGSKVQNPSQLPQSYEFTKSPQRSGQERLFAQNLQFSKQRDRTSTLQAQGQNQSNDHQQYSKSDVLAAQQQTGKIMNRIYTPYTTTINHRHHRMTSGSGSISKVSSNMASPKGVTVKPAQKPSPPKQSELIQSLQTNLRNSFNNNYSYKQQQQIHQQLSGHGGQVQLLNHSEQEETLKESFNNLHEDDDEMDQVGSISPRNTTSMRPSMKKLSKQRKKNYRDPNSSNDNSGRRHNFTGGGTGAWAQQQQQRQIQESMRIQDEQKKVESIETQEDITVPLDEYESEEDGGDNKQIYTSQSSALLVSGPFSKAAEYQYQKRMHQEGSEEYEEVDVDGNNGDALVRNSKGDPIYDNQENFEEAGDSFQEPFEGDGQMLQGRAARAQSSEFQVHDIDYPDPQHPNKISQRVSKLDYQEYYRRTSNALHQNSDMAYNEQIAKFRDQKAAENSANNVSNGIEIYKRPSTGNQVKKDIRTQLQQFNRNSQLHNQSQPENIAESPIRNDVLSRNMVGEKDQLSKQKSTDNKNDSKTYTPRFQIRSHQNLKELKSPYNKMSSPNPNMPSFSQKSNGSMHRMAKTTRQIYHRGAGQGGFKDDQHSENLIEQCFSPTSLSSGSNSEHKLRMTRAVHSPANKFQQKQHNKPGNLGGKNQPNTKSAAILSDRKKDAEKWNQFSYPNLVSQTNQMKQRKTLKDRLQTSKHGFETHRLPNDQNQLSARDFSTGNKISGIMKKATKVGQHASNFEAKRKSVNIKSKSKSNNRQATRTNPTSKVLAPRQPMSKSNLQLTRQGSNNIVDQDVQNNNDSGPNRFPNDFTSPVVSKKKNALHTKNRNKKLVEQKVEHFTPVISGQYGLDSHLNVRIDLVEGEHNKVDEADDQALHDSNNPSFKVPTIEQSMNLIDEHPTPSTYKLMSSQTKSKMEEGKRRVGRGQQQGNPTQSNNRVRSDDSDFQNVDEKVNEGELESANNANTLAPPTVQSNTAGKVRISITDEEIHNQIKHQNLNQVVENQVMHGAQPHSELFQAQQSVTKAAPRLPSGIRLQAGKPPTAEGPMIENYTAEAEPINSLDVKHKNVANIPQSQQQTQLSARRLPSKSVYVYNQAPKAEGQLENAKSIPNLRIDLQQPQLQSLHNSNAPRMQHSVPAGVSVFESMKQQSQSRLQALKQNMFASFSSLKNDESAFWGGEFKHAKAFEIKPELQAKLIEEVYFDDGGFFSFFSAKNERKRTTKEVQDTERQRTSDLGPQGNIAGIGEVTNSEYFSASTNRHLENYKEECRQRKEKRMQETQRALDPLDSLWLMLDEQDDELIQAESCQLYLAGSSSLEEAPKRQLSSTKQRSVRRGGNEYQSMYQNCGVYFDLVPEVHQHAQILLANARDPAFTHSIIAQKKAHALRNFMKLKVQKQQWLEECSTFNLRNSVVPAIQGHILLNQKMRTSEREMLLNTVLSNRNVFEAYGGACQGVQDWTQVLDFGPFEQGKTDESESLGECITSRASTHEFFMHKQYQVDQDVQGINTKFNPYNCMFYVDAMGNLLSNMKLAFYESPEDANFISKYILASNQNDTREFLVSAYRIVREIYDDILTPIRQRQIRDCPDLQILDNLQLNRMKQLMASNRNLDEIRSSAPNFSLLTNDKEPEQHFYDYHCWHVLDINSFKMTEVQYKDAIIGLPTDAKSKGITSQIYLKKKLDSLKQELIESKNEFEFKLLFYIQFLQSIQYNMNIFGHFNPLCVSEQEIIDNMKQHK